MTVVESRAKKWGNSFGVVIPRAVVEEFHIKEETPVHLIFLKDSKTALRKMFGLGKQRLKKSTQQMMDEAREELYD